VNFEIILLRKLLPERKEIFRMWELILPILGFSIGLLAAITGVGGGIFIVPLLTLAFSYTPANAVGTSLTTILFTAIAATVVYSSKNKIYYKTGTLLALTTIPGAVLGAYLTSIVPSYVLGLVFSVFLILVAVQIIIKTGMLRKRKQHRVEVPNQVNSEKAIFANKKRLIFGMFLSFFGGVASGLLGIGGGIIIVPIMTLQLGMSIHLAVATSMFTMIATSLSGVGQHYFLGNINFEYALLLGLGSVFGAQSGAYICDRISGKSLQIIFGLFLLIVSVQMMVKFV
jgi:uncharacterized membrane protein YfcA